MGDRELKGQMEKQKMMKMLYWRQKSEDRKKCSPLSPRADAGGGASPADGGRRGPGVFWVQTSNNVGFSHGGAVNRANAPRQ